MSLGKVEKDTIIYVKRLEREKKRDETGFKCKNP